MAGQIRGARTRKTATKSLLNEIRQKNKVKNSEKTEDIINVDIPCPPETLDEIALAEWKEITAILGDLGILTKADKMALAMYCDAFSTWVYAGREIIKLKKENLVVVGKRNGGKYRDPWFDIRKQAQQEIFRYLALFGLSPSDRARLKTAAPGGNAEKDNPFSKI